MASLREFFESYSSSPALHRAVWRKGGVAFSDYKDRPYDFRDPSSGSVPGLIYYSDTVPFGKRKHGEIICAVRELGCIDSLPCLNSDGETHYYNWLTWFAWESMANELNAYLGV